MFEKMRDTWTKAVQPLVLRMGDLDPSVLTWTSLVISVVSFYLLAVAGMDSDGAMMIIGAVVLVLIAGLFDALELPQLRVVFCPSGKNDFDFDGFSHHRDGHLVHRLRSRRLLGRHAGSLLHLFLLRGPSLADCSSKSSRLVARELSCETARSRGCCTCTSMCDSFCAGRSRSSLHSATASTRSRGTR